MMIDTGEHYEYELTGLLYEQLGIRRPDILLGSAAGTGAVPFSTILTRAVDVFSARRPWAVIVIGDTDGTVACTLAAGKLRIPVIHVEAGLRVADSLLPAEINRRSVDAISALLCAPSVAAERRLRDEGRASVAVLTGDVAFDALRRSIDRAPQVTRTSHWPLEPDEPFVFATFDTPELTDDPERMRVLAKGLEAIGLPVILAAHPRVHSILERSGLLSFPPRMVHVRPPFGYLEALACIRDARVVVTDSGGVQRESYWLGTPCVTLRQETEWVETIALGANVLLDPDTTEDELPRVIAARLAAPRGLWDREVYGQGDAAERIADAVERLVGSKVLARQ
jgi:UDP-N-acetylglucosamine 2-epimerase